MLCGSGVLCSLWLFVFLCVFGGCFGVCGLFALVVLFGFCISLMLYRGGVYDMVI